MTPLRVPRGVALARREDVPDAGAIVVYAGEGDARVSLILTHYSGGVSCFRNRCAHANYPLQRADGRIVVQEARYLVCAAHGASYSLIDGACAGGPCNGEGLERVAVIVRDGIVFTA
ncbi:MAG TPA: Rieske 2Fe-2S domain-containing protein [Candidatus Binatia bacterium]|nr:Rieske 2Fe-2S domain-containing protein [Candidatus Binatia bacterium]